MKTKDELMAGLPGEEMIRKGLVDLAAGHQTIPACLVAVARTRLTSSGVISDAITSFPAEPELELYQLLRREGGDAYSRYNSLIRELVSFENALDCRISASRKNAS